MHRLAVAIVFLLAAIRATAQSPASDPQAISLARQSVVALTGGNVVSDVTLNASVTSSAGSDPDTGTGTFQAKGTTEARVDLNLLSGNRSDVRYLQNGLPGGAWQTEAGASTAYAQHNCWTDAAWFFPALSSLTQTANSHFIFKYVGLEKHAGAKTQHVQVYQLSTLRQLGTMDFYLDAASSLPVAIAFNLHADDNMSTNVPMEVRFGNYQSVNGIQIPFHFQQLQNGAPVIDATVTNAVLNTGLLDSLFALQ
jgi:hypothetical protein